MRLTPTTNGTSSAALYHRNQILQVLQGPTMSRNLVFSLGFTLMIIGTLFLMADAAPAPATDRNLPGKFPVSVPSTCSGKGRPGSLCGTSACPCTTGAYSNYCNEINPGKCSCPFNICDETAELNALAATVQAQVGVVNPLLAARSFQKMITRWRPWATDCANVHAMPIIMYLKCFTDCMCERIK
jgi:hypothetical protein